MFSRSWGNLGDSGKNRTCRAWKECLKEAAYPRIVFKHRCILKHLLNNVLVNPLITSNTPGKAPSALAPLSHLIPHWSSRSIIVCSLKIRFRCLKRLSDLLTHNPWKESHLTGKMWTLSQPVTLGLMTCKILTAFLTACQSITACLEPGRILSLVFN